MKQSKWLMGMVPVALLAASTAWAATDASLNTNVSGASTSNTSAGDLPGAQFDGAFGLGGQDFWVGATQFYPRSASQSLVYNGFYYWYSTGGQHEAQFQLPNGSLMQVFRCYFNDISAGNDGSVGLWRQYFNSTSNSPGNENLATVNSTGSSGYQDPSATPTNNTFVSRGGTSFNELNLYTMIANLPAGDTQVNLRGCRVFYARQIAPAPATATFSDVPVGSQFFAEVEALAKSGITAGCTASAYCPGNNVTRLQMAAFLARALGLHWPPF